MKDSGELTWPPGTNEEHETDSLIKTFIPTYGRWLVKSLSLEDVTHLSQDVAEHLSQTGAVKDVVSALELHQSRVGAVSALQRAYSFSPDDAGLAYDLAALLVLRSERADERTARGDRSRAADLLCAILDPAAAHAPRAAGEHPSWATHAMRRVARMERWLLVRAESDASAQPSADLCLWALEHLEHASHDR